MCSFALPASAADGTESIDTLNDMSVYAFVFDEDSSTSTGGSFIDVSDTLDIVQNTSGPYSGHIRYTFPASETTRLSVGLRLGEDFNFNSSHEYTLEFSWGVNVLTNANCLVTLNYYDSKGVLLKEQVVADSDYPYLSGVTAPQSVSIDFKPDVSGLDSGYNCELTFLFTQTGLSDYAYQRIFVSSEIQLIDKDDDSGWFQKIINKIEETISNIKQIPEKINQKLTELKESITNAFVELKENLIEGLKGLFVPSDGFFEEKKAELELFLEDHFGILWTAPNIMISTIEQLLTMSPEEPSITMPAIQFTWEDELITLTEPMTVNFNDYIGEGTPLETFYNFYRVFVTIILIFLFINYCLKKYHYIFGKDGEAVEH